MATAVLLHPHPDMGGNQHNNVVTALYERLPAIGVTPHRFDFSSSDISVARAEALAAIDQARPSGGGPLYLVGYSFGGGVAATIDHPAIAAWGLIAPALTLAEPVIGPDPRPKYVIAAEHDQWIGPDSLAAATAGWVATSPGTVRGTDHFFGGPAAAEAAELIATWIEAQPAGS